MDEMLITLTELLPIDSDLRAALLALLSEPHRGEWVHVDSLELVAKRAECSIEELFSLLLQAQAEGWVGEARFVRGQLRVRMQRPE